MKAIDQLATKLRAIGGSVDEYDDFFCLDAPSGYVWSCNGNPSISIRWANHSQTWLTQAIKEEMPSIQMGLEKVTDKDRLEEIRWNNGDEWGAPENAPARIEWA